MKQALLPFLALALTSLGTAPLPPAPAGAEDRPPRLLIYPGDLTLVEELQRVVLPSGPSTVRIDFVRGNADVASLEVVPLDHPDDVKIVALQRRNDLPNATFVELEAKAAVTERLRITYAARGLATQVRYVAVFDDVGKTLDLVQELEVSNGSGESFARADVRSVFGDVKQVSPNAVMHGRAPDPQPGAPTGIPSPPLRQDLAEHTVVSFGEPVALPTGVTIRRVTLEKTAVPLTVEYRYDAAAAGGLVTRRLKAPNADGAGLGGVTLQPGSLYLVERKGEETERFLSTGGVPHVPKGKELELDAGVASDMLVERDNTDVMRTDLVFGEYNRALVSYTVEEAYRVEIRSHAAEVRSVLVTEHVGGTSTFEVMASSVPPTRKDQNTLEFRVDVSAGGTLEITYRVKKTNVKP